MFNFETTGLPEMVEEWVKDHPEESDKDEQAIDSFVNQEFEVLTVYTTGLISLWVELGTPAQNTEGYMEEYGNIFEAIRTEVMYAFTAEARAWCFHYMNQLREGLQ